MKRQMAWMVSLLGFGRRLGGKRTPRSIKKENLFGYFFFLSTQALREKFCLLAVENEGLHLDMSTLYKPLNVLVN